MKGYAIQLLIVLAALFIYHKFGKNVDIHFEKENLD